MVVAFPTKEKLVAEVEAMGYEASIVESADEVSLYVMLNFQATYQTNYTDNAVSFTVNFPEGRYALEEAAEVVQAFLPELKGTTLMPDGTREQAPYERVTEAEFNRYEVTSIEDSTDEECSTDACPKCSTDACPIR